MIVEIRKVISAPLIKKVVGQVCEDSGMSPTEYAYSLILEDVNKRLNNDRLCSDLANGRLSPKSFLGEVLRIVEKYEKDAVGKYEKLTYAK
jgi:hypothetical protein